MRKIRKKMKEKIYQKSNRFFKIFVFFPGKNCFLDDFSNLLDLFRSVNSIFCMFKVREVAHIGRGHFPHCSMCTIGRIESARVKTPVVLNGHLVLLEYVL
jgi:hypothetical protein